MPPTHESLPESPRSQHEPIAIVGTGCRFPGEANTPGRLWDLLREPYDLLRKVPEDRFSAEGFFNKNSDYHGNSNVRHSYFLSENVRAFDPQFFGVSPIEAHAMDPQQRILLEVVYEALEAGGHAASSLRGSDTGVYVGVMCADYETMLLRDTDTMPTYQATGTARSILSNRISYFFDWNGPSMTIDTACSSSLVALHQAVQALRSGDCQTAIAAGTNLILGANNYIGESKLKMLSPTGRSRMWDADADGYARGEGVAAVVLKRLSSAIKDGDHIECIVRETGINQDGRTRGITMPSATAQASLIRQVYSRAGLDPLREEGRCQFFECHGTGTPAGDPIEAEAIRNAFFGSESSQLPNQSPLYVGSIKTVVGHTEGTAGLAALIKASLAVQHSTIPPNLLFSKLSPAVAPFYKGVQIPTEPTSWPTIGYGQPRRASVNSFGFGGANAHAIIESYETVTPTTSVEPTKNVAVPFVFSANSARSLKLLLQSFATYVQNDETVQLGDLAWTLFARRSLLPARISISADSRDTLVAKLKQAANSSDKFRVGPTEVSNPRQPRILGVFTGQGAQWSAMGRGLILLSKTAQERLTWLDAQLHILPEEDRPTWSMKQKLLDGDDITKASFAQPICTAIQILLIDLLQSCGRHLDSVVGHSSGEIAAAYAAGYISAQDACRIAYYRGLHAEQASTDGGRSGKMMAVATSPQDARELCELPHFRGRIVVAASNAPNSVTVSGDADAVMEAQVVFFDEGKAAKVLFVDKAYHSHHMSTCASAYEASMRWFQPRFAPSSAATSKWFSTVYNEAVHRIPDKMNLEYWNTNMVQEVMFSSAIEKACTDSGPFDAAVEIGPHPALRGPVLETLAGLSSSSVLPYTGLLQRGRNDMEAISDALGFLWTLFGSSGVSLKPYLDLLSGPRDYRLLTNLPKYTWDNAHDYWHESRTHRGFRTRKDPTHPLLGNLQPDGTLGSQYRWRNLLSVKEVPWLDGHKLQGQTVFPAAGYCSMAFQASKVLLDGRSASALALEDVTIHSALVFQDDNTAVETLFTLDIREETEKQVRAKFVLFATSGADLDSLTIKASGYLIADLGSHRSDILPARADSSERSMISVNTDRFYSSLTDLGYGYTGLFRALDHLSRKAGQASGTLYNKLDPNSESDQFLIHPATLDTAIQAVILAYCYPMDGRLFAIHVPTHIRSIRINPHLCSEYLANSSELVFDSAHSGENSNVLSGDVDLFSTNGNCIVQLEEVRCILFAQATAADDAKIFSKTVWKPAEPDCFSVCWDGRAGIDDYELATDLERVCLYYLNLWESQVPHDHASRTSGPLKGLFRFSSHTRTQVANGKHKHGKQAWMNDTADVIEAIKQRHSESLDMRMVDAVGRNIPDVVMGKTTILEHLLKDNLLTEYYRGGLGHPSYTSYLARTMAQISHRYPNMNVVEIGAGTGHATKRIFAEIGSDGFGSYTYTDLSSGFFEKAQDTFPECADKMVFRVLDIEKDVATQGFELHSFDVVVASLVLHATSSLDSTLRNVRRLLKPGGYLIMLEQTNNEPMRYSFMFGSLPGWWVGEPDGRLLSPCVGPVEWDTLLRRTGFSGVDSITDDVDRLPYPASVMVAQAVSQRTSLLREPLVELGKLDQESIGDELFIIGGSTLKTARLVQRARSLLSTSYTSITCYNSFADMAVKDITPTTSVLNVSDLDCPVFENLTEKSFSGMKAAFQTAKMIVWFTADCRTSSPYANMSIGFGRSMLLEIPGLQLQFIDMENREVNAELISNALLRFSLVSTWDMKGQLGHDMLCSVEMELACTQDGFKVPRLRTDLIKNNRYNSSRRHMTEKTSLLEYNVCVVGQDNASGYVEDDITTDLETGTALHSERDVSISSLRARTFDTGTTVSSNFSESAMPSHSLSTAPEKGAGLSLIRVQYSSIAPVSLGRASAMYVVLGTEDNSERLVASLSETRSSCILSAGVHGVKLPEAGQDGPRYSLGKDSLAHTLATICDNLICLRLLSILNAGQVLLVHEPPPRLATTLAKRAAEIGAMVIFTTVLRMPGWGSAEAVDRLWTSLPCKATQRHILRSLPQDIAIFVDLATNAEACEVGQSIAKCLSHQQTRCLSENVFSKSASLFSADSEVGLHGLLQEAMEATLKDLQAAEASHHDHNTDLIRLVRLAEFAQWNKKMALESVLDWTTGSGPDSHILATLIKPVDSKPLFRANRTYWLVGLTGDLGLSLAEWMIQHGAKHIILSSRNPRKDNAWLKKMQGFGGSVHMWSNDVTDIQDVRRCYEEMSRTLPPLGGVAQGAMVLQDMAIREMDLETMLKVLRPKVQGSNNLVEVIGQQKLDFFVFLSSMASVVGNMGQSNYTAANMFMATLAEQRRARGLCASTINIGVIIGLGYVTREADEASQDNMYTSGYQFMSEQTFHQMFAEAVLAGQESSDMACEISTGLRHVKATDERQPIWANNSRFSHHIIHTAAGGSRDDSHGRTVPLKVQLETAASQEEVFQIVLDAFLAKLQVLLKVDPHEYGTQASVLALRTDSLGIDSLVAVEIRTWFLKTLQVNMPVLKILGGASLEDLLVFAVPQIPTELTPMIKSGTKPTQQSLEDIKPQQDVSVLSSGPLSLSSSATTGSPPSPANTDTPAERSGPGTVSTSLQGDEDIGAIAKEERSGSLSYSQSMFWFVNHFVSDRCTLNHTGSFRIRGKIRTADLQRAVIRVGMHHESLRTCFNAMDGAQPIQTVMSSTSLQLAVERITTEQEVSTKFEELSQHIYDIGQGELLRVILLTLAVDEHYLLIGCHHINMDGYSHQVFMRDLEKAYNDEQMDETLQYLDYAIRQNEESMNGMWVKDLEHWRHTLHDLPPAIPVLNLPDAKSRGALTAYQFHRVRIDLGVDLSIDINRQARHLHATPFHFYLAALRSLLIRYGVIDDFCMGLGDANRSQEDTLHSIGPYLNLLPLRCSALGDTTQFSEVLSDTRKRVLECLSHSKVPLGAILDDLQLSRSQYYSPLFQTFIDYRETSGDMSHFAGMDMEMLKFETGRTGYDVNVDIINTTSGCVIELMVQSSLYSQNDCEILAGSYRKILEAFSSDPSQSIHEPSIFEEMQIHEALALSRGVSCASQWPETLIHRVVEVAGRSSDEPSISDGTGASLTYSQLLDRVECIADNLLASGLGDGSIVGIFHERTVDWICAMLAIMYAGATYLPLDPNMPNERLLSMIQNCRPASIVTDHKILDRIATLELIPARIIDMSTISRKSSGRPPIKAHEDAAGVIFYTSGSTGTPKGIAISHRSLKNEVEFSASTYGIGVERVLQQSAFSFDMSLTQIFGALAFGGYLYICPSAAYADPVSLSSLIVNERITMTGGTPSEYLSWINSSSALGNSSWRIAISGGEPVSKSLLRAFKSLDKTDLLLYNAYGPTEVTCSSNRKQIQYADEEREVGMTAGKPAPNARVYIVDAHLHPLPVGFSGEIVVGGAGVAMGYMHNADETAKSFVPDPFADLEEVARGWVSVHKTGDRGRLTKDGELFVEGRINGDTQIKLRGLRIDLREVENAIKQVVGDALIDVIAWTRHELADSVVAHAVFSPNASSTSEALGQYIAMLPLPRYMKPAVIIPVSDLPRGATGKIDRKAVSQLPIPMTTSTAAAVGTMDPDTEEMHSVWAQTVPGKVLSAHLVTPDTDFFHVGGNSVLLVELQQRIQAHYGVHLPLVQLFDSSTLGRMTALVQATPRSAVSELDWDLETEPLPMLMPCQPPHPIRDLVRSPPRVIVLTGATGYLGRHLLNQLVTNHDVEIIHCLAVRNPQRILPLHEKVQVHAGDLGAPRLGLSEESAASIFAVADVVIHNGADVSHLKHYRTLRAANVASTRELVRMCIARSRRPTMHYISTAGVAAYTGLDEFAEVSVASHQPPKDGADGYTASKWASEILLEKASGRSGLDVAIHRPSNIARQDVPEMDLLQNMLKYSQETSSVPFSSSLQGFLNIVGVEECARGILEMALLQPSPSPSPSGGTVRYFHSIGDFNLRLDNLKEHVASLGTVPRNGDIVSLSLSKWADNAEVAGMHPAVAAFFRHTEEQGTIRYPLLIRGPRT
ncbi:hypothetical protein N0V93_001970 [Gnomoniopsis smithogilvyi]|uniref:Polyketide synthase n=1 Tax=Gnomoniopsis smithogilvyi TaxID=1191159 RepID=A0A9W8Z4V4_9PEZI|nr:hypothetical protein N0V93_001970 [Gnomoniopsis smithogilvyi]